MAITRLWPDNYTPECLDDFVLLSETREKLIQLVRGVTQLPSHGINGILLYGPYGTGKSALAKRLPHLLEQGKVIDGRKRTDDELLSEAEALTITGVELEGNDFQHRWFNCRDGLNWADLQKEIAAQYSALFYPTGGHFYQVLDELDELGRRQSSLKGLMNSSHRTIFIMTTNHLGLIDGGIRSRSILLDCSPAPYEAWVHDIRKTYTRHGIPDLCPLNQVGTELYLKNEIPKLNGDARKIHDLVQMVHNKMYPV